MKTFAVVAVALAGLALAAPPTPPVADYSKQADEICKRRSNGGLTEDQCRSQAEECLKKSNINIPLPRDKGEGGKGERVTVSPDEEESDIVFPNEEESDIVFPEKRSVTDEHALGKRLLDPEDEGWAFKCWDLGIPADSNDKFTDEEWEACHSQGVSSFHCRFIRQECVDKQLADCVREENEKKKKEKSERAEAEAERFDLIVKCRKNAPKPGGRDICPLVVDNCRRGQTRECGWIKEWTEAGAAEQSKTSKRAASEEA
ncbi:hypothetical protein CDD83_8014 [Cordyceps sp. RAO-2017]|nr:hypothetical protein CDD83_8014 [Cordyceps sp. RAO-2017]